MELGGLHLFIHILQKKLKKDPIIARSDENERYRPKRTKMSLLLGVRDFGISLKVTFVFNFWPVAIFFMEPLGDTVQSAF